MTGKLLIVRIIQFRRGIGRVGFIYSFLIFSAYLLLQYLAVGFIVSKVNAVIFASAVCLLLSVVHHERTDRDFIIVNFDKPGLTFFAEYVLLSLIFMPALFISGYWVYSIIPLVFSRLVSYHGYYGKSYSGSPYLFLSKIFKPVNFEWLSGIRKSFIPVILLYLAAIALSPIKFVSLLAIWLLASFVVSFYRECESLQLILTSGKEPSGFLFDKLKRHCGIFCLFILPAIILYVIFNPSHWVIGVTLFVVLNMNLVFTILYKYSLYEPDYILSGSSILVTIVQLSVFIPFLVIFTVVMIFRNYYKAKMNLSKYLNA